MALHSCTLILTFTHGFNVHRKILIANVAPYCDCRTKGGPENSALNGFLFVGSEDVDADQDMR